jgi:hypothetical protein
LPERTSSRPRWRTLTRSILASQPNHNGKGVERRERQGCECSRLKFPAPGHSKTPDVRRRRLAARPATRSDRRKPVFLWRGGPSIARRRRVGRFPAHKAI